VISERVLVRAAFSEPHRTYATTEDLETAQTRNVSMAIKELIKKEILAADLANTKNSHSQAE
jgi:hypothetical protein